MATTAALWTDLLTGEELAHLTTEPARSASSEPIPPDLHPRVRTALESTGVAELFTHQAEAWEAAQRGEHVIVTTGTASGKTLAFNLPVLDALARNPKQRALYLYPTKALAQDQVRALAKLQPPGVKPAIYDGDTPTEQRWQVRKWANLILTNPDMLHVGVLPHHDRWGDVLSNLRYVVRRRGARLSRRVRLPRGQRPPPTATACAGLRRRAAVPARVSHDRKPR